MNAIQERFYEYMHDIYTQSFEIFGLFFSNLAKEELLVSLGRFFLLPSLVQTTLVLIGISPVLAVSALFKTEKKPPLASELETEQRRESHATEKREKIKKK